MSSVVNEYISEVGDRIRMSQLNKILPKSVRTQYGITIGIHGKHRTGKTLTAIMLIVYYLLRRKNIKGVISNVELDLSAIDMKEKYTPMQDIRMLGKDEYKDYIVFTDEFRRFCDSRMSGSFKNLFISNLLSDTGKFKQVHILTDQDGGAVDKRIRLNADVVLHPIIDLKRGICRVKCFETYSNYFWIVANDWLKDWKSEFVYEIEPYFKYFDTEQKIEDFYLTFKPEDYATQLSEWLKVQGLIDHPDFVLKASTILLWKEMTGAFISGEQRKALMEYLFYYSDLPMRGKTSYLEKKKDEE